MLAKSLPMGLGPSSLPYSIALHILFLVCVSNCLIINYLVMVVTNLYGVSLLAKFIAFANINSFVFYHDPEK